MNIAKLIVSIAVHAEGVDQLKKVEEQTDKTAKTATKAAKATKDHKVNTEQLTQRARDAAKVMMAFQGTLVGVFGALTATAIAASKVALNLSRFTLNTGLSMQGLQQFQQQMALSGVSAEETTQAVAGLQQAMLQVKVGEGNPYAFTRLGLAINENDPIGTLMKLKERLAELDKKNGAGYGTMFAQQLGLSPQVIAAVRELGQHPVNKTLIPTEAEMVRLKNFNVYYNRFMTNVQFMLQKLGAVSIPISKDVLDFAENFISKLTAFGELISAHKDSFNKFSGLIKILGLGIAIWLAPTVGIVIALVSALEDLLTFAEGGDSAIGRLIGFFSEWRNVLYEIIGLLAMVAAVAAKGWHLLRGEDDPEEFGTKLGRYINAAYGALDASSTGVKTQDIGPRLDREMYFKNGITKFGKVGKTFDTSGSTPGSPVTIAPQLTINGNITDEKLKSAIGWMTQSGKAVAGSDAIQRALNGLPDRPQPLSVGNQ